MKYNLEIKEKYDMAMVEKTYEGLLQVINGDT